MSFESCGYYFIMERKFVMRGNDRQEQYIIDQKVKEEIYREYPEIEKLNRAKNRWMRFLMCYMLVYRMVYMTDIIQWKKNYPISMIGSCIMGYIIYCCFLSFCMGTRAQNVYNLYILIVQAVYSVFKHYQGITSIDMLLQEYHSLLQNHLLYVISDILFWIEFVIHVGITIWLTLIPKNRRLAKQFDTLMKNAGKERNSSNISSMARWHSMNDDNDEEDEG